MKKTTIKATKAPAPASKKVASKTVKKTVAAPAKKSVALAVKAVASKPAGTMIGATIDIGFGNLLYIRGEGAGLSWEEGILLECVKDDLWSISLPETSKPIVYKLLINDLTWSVGPDYVATSGKKTSVTPAF